MRQSSLAFVFLVWLYSGWRVPSAVAAEPTAIDYNRDVRPILSNNCFKCHGPDAKQRQSGLRLDLRGTATGPAESGEPAIVPGSADESELVRRVFSSDPTDQMPPPDSKKKLSQAEREMLKRWIAAGAEYRPHWSLIPPARPSPPAVNNRAWPRNEIDAFVLARQELAAAGPSLEADRTTLIRRVTLDLTGLPPTPREVDEFLADRSDNAYEKLVDRLLDSPRYGERMAMEWLDAARFADTHGFHIDSGRDMSRWREWVIGAFNQNMPFDRFTIDQLAGDMRPGATLAEQVASGFNRNHMINFEGGAIPEEYHNAYIVDRVNTTSTVWLGLTVGCAQCHDHKYDPITQKEFYQLYAFFHNVPENGLDGAKGNAAPLVKAPSPEQRQGLDESAAAIGALEARLAGPQPEIDAAQFAWEDSRPAPEAVVWNVVAPSELKSQGNANFDRLDDGSIRVTGPNPPTDTYTCLLPPIVDEITAVRLEALADDGLADRGPGRSGNGNIVLTEFRLETADSPDAVLTPARIKAASADFSQEKFPVAAAVDGQTGTGWAILPEVGKPHAAVFESEQPIRPSPAGRRIVTLEFQSPFGQHQLGRFRLAVTSARQPHPAPAWPDAVRAALAVARPDRSEQQHRELRDFYRATVSPEGRAIHEQLARLRASHAALDGQVGTAMVMSEGRPRETFILVRGQYDRPGQRVTPAVPASLPPLPEGASADRMGLARWLVDRSNPLVSRVIVNRYWQLYFGVGLVKTSEDFGSQGEPPTHPELLDWLATEFVDHGWDVKRMQRLIVTSATYRQSSRVTPEMLAKDPENRLLARASRLRLPAELIRDQALSAAGLLDERIGGASVSPYQPPGIWEELASRADGANWTAQTYTQSHGRDLYRRTMYTYWKRTAPPPSLVTFDAPDRETCTIRRARTNTPLQALILLNDPTYVEAARKLAERVLREPAGSVEERISLAFRLAAARKPRADEIAALEQIRAEQVSAYRADSEAAKRLLAVGESPRDEQLDPADLAAWTIVASTILNLDETVVRP